MTGGDRPPPLRIGTHFGPYEILGPLGAGGMGEVYRARDARLGRDIALKVLPAQLSADPGRLRRFEQEARIAGTVNHPNVLAVFDVGNAEGAPYLVSELLEGETLRRLLHDQAPSPRKVLDYAAQLARGLAAAHDKGVVHRDLKPENVFITSDGRVKILDFGLAKLTQVEGQVSEGSSTITRETAPGAVLGTIGYMAPEQVRGDPADARSDIFAFGALLYEMLSGRPAFGRGNASDTMAAILRDDPLPMSPGSGPQVAGLERILRRCLEKRPGERFHSAHDLALALEAVSEPSGAPVAVPGRRRSWWAAAAVALVLATGAAVVWRARRTPPARGIPTIAVLPLQNLSRDPDQDYFADGMTEALITDLAKVGGLRVISRTSVMRYKGTRKPLHEIARELKVQAVLEGSVQQSGDSIRITAQLIDAGTDQHLWADSYDRDLRDVLALQSEVAQETSRAVRVTLSAEDQAQLARARAIDPDSYRLYLRARHLLNQRTTLAGIKQAMDLLEQVIAQEPSWAPARAALAEGYSVLDDWGEIPPEEAYPKAIEAAQRALELDPQLADAHASLGHILIHQRRWSDAKRELSRAIELNRSLAVAHRWYGTALTWTGDIEAGVREARQAWELDPSSAVSASAFGQQLLYARRYDEAIDQFRKAAEIDPRSDGSPFMMAWVFALQDRNQEALAAARRAWELTPDRANKIMLAYVHAKAGRRDEARTLLAELQASTPPSGEPLPANMAHLYVALGDKEKALSMIEQGFRDRPGQLTGIWVSPDMDALRDDPRFQRIVTELRTDPTAGGGS